MTMKALCDNESSQVCGSRMHITVRTEQPSMRQSYAHNSPKRQSSMRQSHAHSPERAAKCSSRMHITVRNEQPSMRQSHAHHSSERAAKYAVVACTSQSGTSSQVCGGRMHITVRNEQPSMLHHVDQHRTTGRPNVQLILELL